MALKFAVNNSLSAVTSLPTAIPTGSMTLLQTQTASSSSSIDFTSNIDSTYDSYELHFFDVHPQSGSRLAFQGTTDGSNFNVTMTTTSFVARHTEDNSTADFGYNTGDDQAQGTSYQRLSCGGTVETDNDASATGIIKLYNPSSTTFVKHFLATMQIYNNDQASHNSYVAGYFNTTSAITGLSFKYESGNIDNGVFKLYGIS